jgi:hypothetical protein
LARTCNVNPQLDGAYDCRDSRKAIFEERFRTIERVFA